MALLDKRSPNQQLLPLTAKTNQHDRLEIGGCDVVELLQQFGSPLYILDEVSLRTACQQYRDAFATYYQGESQVIYASKAWNCLAVCAIVASEGLGIDVVSGGELFTALQAGVSPDLLYLHGNNKSQTELAEAIACGCTIVIDNWLELKTVSNLAQNFDISLGKSPRIMLRITPGIECHTHEYIQTGHLDSKFGFDPTEVESVFAFLSNQQANQDRQTSNQIPHRIPLNCIGIHAHIGSQIFELQPHQDLGKVMMTWFEVAQKYNLNLTELNIGGGLGISYTESDDPPSISAWVKTVSDSVMAACKDLNLALPKLISEPGRSLIGTACVTAYTIGSSKTVPQGRTYVTIDGGMSDNPRPITYQSQYLAVVANRMGAESDCVMTIAGKHCESGDILIKDIQLPKLETGDTLVVLGTGAYNYSMASNYNRIPKLAAVLVNAGEANSILRRETYADLIRQDLLPQRLQHQA